MKYGDGNPRANQPNDDPRLHPNPAPDRSLVETLGGVADDLRQLYTDFGLRPYRMFSVVYRWTGGEVGRGEPLVISTEEFLPTPNVSPRGVRGALREAGLVERGDVTVTQISPRYTEDQVRTLFHCLPLPPGLEGFIEVTVDSRDGESPRRRFTVIGVPARDADRFEWVATMTRQDASRLRDGQPNPVGLRVVR